MRYFVLLTTKIRVKTKTIDTRQNSAVLGAQVFMGVLPLNAMLAMQSIHT